MKSRWIAFVALLYPRSWREEFGAEFGALLDDVKPGWRVFANVLRGALEMQVTTGTSWIRVTAVAGVIGAIVAGGLSFTKAPHYVSSATISVTPQPDPVRGTSPAAMHDRTASHVAEMGIGILSRTDLSAVINDPRLDLYSEERKRMALEDVIQLMRSNIRIEAQSSSDGGQSPIIVSISFSYPDQVKAQQGVRALSSKFTEFNANTNKAQADAYRFFWGDISAYDHRKPPPPPPVGEAVEVRDTTASQPVESAGRSRIVYLTWGLGLGLLMGLLAALAMRWPRGAFQLGGFAVAGCVLAGAASFVIPNRYTSTAVMMISPAVITEDPLAPLPVATPATKFLRQIEPEVVSFQNLSGISQDPRLNLYPTERRIKSMEEVVGNMLANDLRIAPLNPVPVSTGTVSAFSISFSYPNQFLAQQAVKNLVTSFDEQYRTKEKVNVSRSFLLKQITQRGAGEVLDVLDTPSLPASPVKPNRPVIAAMGLVAGLLPGSITIFLRRPRSPQLLAY